MREKRIENFCSTLYNIYVANRGILSAKDSADICYNVLHATYEDHDLEYAMDFFNQLLIGGLNEDNFNQR